MIGPLETTDSSLAALLNITNLLYVLISDIEIWYKLQNGCELLSVHSKDLLICLIKY